MVPLPPISAENFSQLYTSLETLDTSRIVYTLLNIDPIKEEIRKQLRNEQLRVRRKLQRRNKAEMSMHVKEQHHGAVNERRKSLYPQVLRGPEGRVMKKKPRKSQPAKVIDQSYSLTNQHMSSLQATSQPTRLGVVSPSISNASIEPKSELSTGVNNHAAPLLYSPYLNKGFGMYNPLTSQLMSSSYWSQVFKMTANHLLTDYNSLPRFDTPPVSVNSSGLYSATNHISAFLPNKICDLNINVEEDETIDIVDDKPDQEPHGHVPEDRLGSRGVGENELITKETTLNQHEEDDKSTKVNCPDCMQSVFLKSLTEHLQTNCSRNTPTSTEQSSDSSINWESCSICSETVPGRDMIQHTRHRHYISKDDFECNVCNESFRNKSTLKRHKITHTIGGGHTCPYCAKIFAKPELLRRHELLHTEIKRTLWPCSKCNKSFSNKYNLAVHDRMHTGELPFACPECPERFRVKCSMQNHLRSKHLNVSNEASSSSSLDTLPSSL